MKYAIVESGGKQFRAVEGGTIEVDRLPVESGAKIKLEQVLLLADGENITIGTPLVKNIPVWTTVVEHFKGPKVNIFNYSPKKRIRVKIGHRQNYTRLFVEQIGGSELVTSSPQGKKEPVKVEMAVEVKAKKTAPKAKAEKAEKPVKARTKLGTPSTKRASSLKKAVSPKGKKPAAKASAKAMTKPSSRKTTITKAETKTSPKGKTAPKKPAAK
jgi:large subunit ribosomal protein L21